LEWDLILDSIYSYENSFKVILNSLIKGVKIPYEIIQFDKNIRFKFANLQYTEGVTHVDPNVNQALHHYLINTRGEFIKYLLDNNKIETNSINIGLLNNIVFPYIATSKYATNFFNTNTLMFELVQNSLIADRTLLGIFNYQYLSKINYILSSEN
jgi:hypothetical protein